MATGGVYYVSGTTAASAVTDQHAIAMIWNPSATRTVQIVELKAVVFAAPGAGAGWLLRRSTVRGTAGSTVTPTAEHHARREAAPDSGFLLDLAAYSVQPTLAAGDLDGWVYPAVTASGVIIPYPRGLEVPPGTGLGLVNRAAIAFPAAEVSYVVEEL